MAAGDLKSEALVEMAARFGRGTIHWRPDTEQSRRIAPKTIHLDNVASRVPKLVR